MVQGKVSKYPDNVDTDVIIPARYLNTADHKELAAHCMEDIDAQFKNNVKTGRHHGGRAGILAAGRRASTRPLPSRRRRGLRHRQNPLRAFSYRNAINIGLPIFECEAASDGIAAGDEVSAGFRHRPHHQPDKKRDVSGPASAPVHSKTSSCRRAPEIERPSQGAGARNR